MSDRRPGSGDGLGEAGDEAAAGGRVGEFWTPRDTADLVAWLAQHGQTVATAESLTGGLVVAALTDPPGASAVVRGGIVAYHSDIKAALVGVSPQVLAGGAVQAQVALELAAGARRQLRATWGVGTTGVAGPEPADGQPVGTVFIAVCGENAAGEGVDSVVALNLAGDRAAIREATVRSAVALLGETARGGVVDRPGPASRPPQR
ncbi:nicotinamide-nucleotide amidase [Kineosphaera limosa]|uniref:CinA C-terminal domain-containing protein n=1 Tax=Kineosphaera limosa NBRC 100340 TaxID=1184609 RepID=K6WQ98_9MICO|nr:nicotinamide-nucleotide amidohydrolase family protein [Kineosphaera limosa]NYE02847.1 nicotinamide-nucleotide amidase [Kineosphaera limosa]GAB94277.1 hypothetical protein KILIM_004_00670 [Kineosphaera limosa NBRC 100340]